MVHGLAEDDRRELEETTDRNLQNRQDKVRMRYETTEILPEAGTGTLVGWLY